jgi:hypothetical protein
MMETSAFKFYLKLYCNSLRLNAAHYKIQRLKNRFQIMEMNKDLFATLVTIGSPLEKYMENGTISIQQI